ncbi:META domain-containing protein [Weeksellaceae bacterium A-14]|uniref:META domain-containing protein n=1 Tax=Daejeonia sp. YH14 TaxID=3439042 RepID=UPI0031E4D4C6
MKNLIFGIMAATVLFSCTATSTVSKVGKSQPAISGTKWVLADQVKGKTPTLNIEGTKITGNAGCNNYFGEVVLNASSGGFSAGNVGATKMFCDNMSVEDNFLKMLSEANKYVVNGNTLELYKDGLLLLKLNKQQ